MVIKGNKVRKERLDYVLGAVNMLDRKDEKIASFSGGMKQRIGIAQILLHLPRILVVDEPTAYLATCGAHDWCEPGARRARISLLNA